MSEIVEGKLEKHVVGFLRTVLDKTPQVKSYAKTLYYHAIFSLHRLKQKFRSLRFNVDSHMICYVDPSEIRFAVKKEFFLSDRSRVIGGNWDRLELFFENLDVYQAFYQHFIEGKEWSSTLFYKRRIERIQRGETLWNCSSEQEFAQRCMDQDRLYRKIKREGYKIQLEIKSNMRPLNDEDEINVCVGRYGDLMFNNGRHRLCIAKILGLHQIPVKICVRHVEWQMFRKEVQEYAEKHGGKLYQPVTHVDLQFAPSPTHTAFSLIRENLLCAKGKVLDIGAQWGYFCHKLEELGFECYAVEGSRVQLYFLRKLKRACHKKFRVVPISVFDWEKLGTIRFDVVLALNVFHHFIKKKDTYNKLVELLHRIKAKQMFVQFHSQSEKQMETAYRNYNESSFADFILSNSQFENAKHIGTVKDREVWMFQR